MPRITVIARNGEEHSFEANGSSTLMEAIRDHGIDDLLAICGGCCSCATCHVHVDPLQAARLPPMSADEDALLDGSEHRTATSRLSCQLRVADTGDGLKVTIAPAD